MRRLILCALIAGLALGSSVSGAAPTKESAQYVAATVISRNAPYRQEVGVKAGIGGWSFTPPTGRRVVKIKVADDFSGLQGIGIMICSPGCGGDGDIQAGGCTNANGVWIPPRLKLNAVVHVRPQVYSPGGVWAGDATCTNTAHAGTVTVFYGT